MIHNNRKNIQTSRARIVIGGTDDGAVTLCVNAKFSNFIHQDERESVSRQSVARKG
jgi:hypothetical protein